MAFCANCGSELKQGTSFCGNCGTSTTTASASGTQAAAVPDQPNAGGAGLTSNLAGALAYVLGIITGVLFLVLEPYKNDPFVRFHAMQSILYSAACIVIAIVWNILWSIVGSFSGFLFLIALPLRLLISLGFFLFWLFLMYQAYTQREYRIPFIGQIAAKQVG